MGFIVQPDPLTVANFPNVFAVGKKLSSVLLEHAIVRAAELQQAVDAIPRCDGRPTCKAEIYIVTLTALRDQVSVQPLKNIEKD